MDPLADEAPLLLPDEYIDMSFFKESSTTSLRSDRAVLKLLIKPGEATSGSPISNSTVWFQLEGRMSNGELMDKSKARFERKKLRLFSDDFIPGLHVAISSMCKHEAAWFKIEPKLHYYPSAVGSGLVKSMGDIPCEPLFYKIELLDFKNCESVLDKLDFEGRVRKFEESRKHGNDLFHKGEFEKAFKVFRSAIELLLKIPKALKSIMTTEQQKQLELFAEIFYGNAALCKMRGKKWFEAVHLIEEGRKNYPLNAKVLLRLAISLLKCGEFDRSDAICLEIISLFGKSPEITAFQAELSTERKQEKLFEKRRFGGLFSRWEEAEKEEKIEKKVKKIEKNEETTNAKPRDIVGELQKGVILDWKDPGNTLWDEEDGEL